MQCIVKWIPSIECAISVILCQYARWLFFIQIHLNTEYYLLKCLLFSQSHIEIFSVGGGTINDRINKTSNTEGNGPKQRWISLWSVWLCGAQTCPSNQTQEGKTQRGNGNFWPFKKSGLIVWLFNFLLFTLADSFNQSKKISRLLVQAVVREAAKKSSFF